MNQESLQYSENNKEEGSPSLEECFDKGVCPFCEHPTEDAVSAKTHYGFCNEHHLSQYKSANEADIVTRYEQWEPKHVHDEWIQQFAGKLGVPEELVRELHDKQGLTPHEIREQLLQENGQAKAA